MLPDTLRYAPLDDVGVLSVTGPDRRTWLQGMVTMDVVEPFEGAPRYAAMLDGKGRILGELTVVDDPAATRFWLLVESGRAQAIQAALSRLLVAEDVELEVVTGVRVVTLLGPGAGRLAGELAQAEPTVVAVQSHRGDAESTDLVVSASTLDAVTGWLAQAGVTEASLAEIDAFRIHAGIPRWGRDFDEQNLPQEAGLFDAIHWGKGCYVGQEVVARLGHRGQTTRELRRLTISSAVAAGSSVYLPGDPERAVGTVTSVTASPEGVVGIAMLRRRAFDAGTALEIAGEHGPVAAAVSGDRVRGHVPLRPENDPTFKAKRPQRGLGR